MRAPAAVPAAGLVVGCAIGVAAPEIPSVAGVVVLVALSATAVAAWRLSKPSVLALAIGLAFLFGGALLSADAWRRAWRPPLRVAFEALAQRERDAARRAGRRLPEDDEATATIEGVLRGDASVSAAGVSLSLEVDSLHEPGPAAPVHVTGGVQVTVVGTLAAKHMDDWRAGRRVRVPAQLRRPSRYLDPDVPDFERALARRGTTLVGTVKSGALVEVVERGGRLDEITGAVRAFARRAIADAVGSWSLQSAGIVAAIVIGDRAGLDDDLQRRLQEAGTYHVIAISGGNIAIVAGLLLGAFRLGGVLGPTAMAMAIAALAAYARLVGGGASVNRATLVAVVYFSARVLDHRSPPLNTLAVAALCLLVTEPLSVADPALVLTFGATLAILWAVPPMLARARLRLVKPVVGLMAASAAVELMLLPVGALIFSRVTFAGLVLNFAAVPLMSAAQIAGMALVPIALVSARAAGSVGWLAHLAAGGLVRTADLVELMPAATFRVAPPGGLVVVVYYLALASAHVAWGWTRRRYAAAAVAACAGIWIVAEPWAFVARHGDGRMHVTFVDVGQGDAAFVRFPSGTSLLVDAGGLPLPSSFDIGDRVVAPVLRAAGVRRLDIIALTHGDPDHVGGAEALIREFRPRTIWEGIPVPPFEPLRALRAEAAVVGSRWLNLKRGDRTTLDGVDVFVRHPDLPDWERQRVRNDDSIVLELQWRDVSILLTGDIGTVVERTLLTAVRPAPIRVIKVPHHGSLTSSSPDFIRAISPAVAVVSAGRANHFGHPVPEVLQRYRDAGAEIFRTDQDGAVTIDTDGRSIDIHTFSGRQRTFAQGR